MPLLKNHCATELERNLDELRRKKELESLRPHITNANCFHPSKDPETATIVMEDLKRLCRAWKLHEKTRNFWKTATTREAMADALLQHIRDTGKVVVTSKNKNGEDENGSPKPLFGAHPPDLAKRSSRQPSVAARGGKISARLSLLGSANTPIDKPKIYGNFNTQLFGKETEFDNTTTESMLVHTRYFTAPDEETSVRKQVERWRDQNFITAEELARAGKSNEDKEVVYETNEMRDANAKKLQKRRNIATHLHNMSADHNVDLSSLNRQALQVFLGAIETDDPITIEKMLLALANISSCKETRGLLMELNILHYVSPHFSIKTERALEAIAVLIFNLSQDEVVEDQIYQRASTAIQNNCIEETGVLKMTCVYTLNNLLPSPDCRRVGELIVATISSLQTHDRERLHEVFDVVFNMSTFSVLHETIVDCDVVGMIEQASAAAATVGDLKSARLFALTLHNLTASLSNLGNSLKEIKYPLIFLDLDKISDELVRPYSLRALSVMSSNDTSTICDAATDAELLMMMLKHVKAGLDGQLTEEEFLDTTIYLTNLLCNTTQGRKVDFRRIEVCKADGLTTVDILVALCQHSLQHVRLLAARALQSAFAFASLAQDYAKKAAPVLLKVIQGDDCEDAASALFNLSCFKLSELELVRQNVHLALLDWMMTTESRSIKAGCLKVIVQLTVNEQCVIDLLNDELIPKLLYQIKLEDEPESKGKKPKKSIYDEDEDPIPPSEEEQIMWLAVGRVCVAVSARRLDELNKNVEYREALEEILRIICQPLASSTILTQCSWCMAFLSLSPRPFTFVEDVFKVLLEIKDDDAMTAVCSTILYNLTCNSENIEMLLADDYYLNSMIHMMRGGLEGIQSNVVEAMRNLCCHERCGVLLQKGILPDFIVIALLRTNSESIKSVCCDAFFNLLCHESYRVTLIKGDLWWAMMKVARSESERVRIVSGKALFNLACREDYIPILRKAKVLEFAKDIIEKGGKAQTFRQTVLLSVHNVVTKFNSRLQSDERKSCIELCMESLKKQEHKTPYEGSMLLALKLLLRAVHDTQGDKHFDLDVLENLEIASKFWSNSPEAMVLISQIFYAIAQYEQITKSISFHDMLKALMTLHEHLHTSINEIRQRGNKVVINKRGVGSIGNSKDDETFEVDHVDIGIFIRENTAGIMATYVGRGEVSGAELLQCPLWSEIIYNSLAATERGDNSTTTSLALRQHALLLYTFCADIMVRGRPATGRVIQPHRSPSPGMGAMTLGGDSPSPQGTMEVGAMPATPLLPSDAEAVNRGGDLSFIHLADRNLMKGILNDEFIYKYDGSTKLDTLTNKWMAVDESNIEHAMLHTCNLMLAISEFIRSEETAEAMLLENLSTTLIGLLQLDFEKLADSMRDKILCGVGGRQKYVSTIILSLTNSPSLIELMLIDRHLYELLELVFEQSDVNAGDMDGSGVKYSIEIIRDLTTILYRFAHEELYDNQPIDSLKVIQLTEKMLNRCRNIGDELGIRHCRHVIGFTMDKFRMDQTCSMENVQTMVAEADDDKALEVPDQILNREPTYMNPYFVLPEMSLLERGEIFEHTTLLETELPQDSWRFIALDEYKKMDKLVANIDSASPEANCTIEARTPFQLRGYHKIFKDYPFFQATGSPVPSPEKREINKALDLGTPSNYNQYGHSNNQNEKEGDIYEVNNNDGKMADETSFTAILDHASKVTDGPRAPGEKKSDAGDDDYADDDFEADG